jgi:hypothetical protein
MQRKAEVVGLNVLGARTLMRDLSDLLSDAEVLKFASRFEVYLHADQGPIAEIPAGKARDPNEDFVMLDYEHVDLSTAMPGEDYGVYGDDR